MAPNSDTHCPPVALWWRCLQQLPARGPGVPGAGEVVELRVLPASVAELRERPVWQIGEPGVVHERAHVVVEDDGVTLDEGGRDPVRADAARHVHPVSLLA